MPFYDKLFGDQNKKILKQIQPLVDKVNALEPTWQELSDEALKNKTVEFKARLAQGESIDDILPEAFATVREASKRVTGMRHFDVQLMGGVSLHRGMIAEMRTGEGKTLVATLPVYLNALSGKGVHLVTVNDYLAKRDAVWMGQIYDFLGMSVGIVQNMRVSHVYDASRKSKVESQKAESEQNDEKIAAEIIIENEIESFKVEDEYLRPASRQEAYQCDITYGTNNEFGFDYLRDNMVQNIAEMVMRPGTEMHYAIIDEVDSILIDEARTPLIISAPAEEATEMYYQFARLVRQLKEDHSVDSAGSPQADKDSLTSSGNEAGDYNLDEKMRSATLTEAGIAKFEKWLNVDNIYVEGGVKTVHHIEQALKAEVLFKRDRDYIVADNEVVIIDEFTGRKMPGRRYSEGLHQAIEAKENVTIQRESQTLATITFQNLFRMYGKLSGMTGTAATEKEELYKIYGLDVLTIPTNRPDRRHNHPDRIYRSEQGKNQAIVEKIKECRAKKQPILVGTISVEKNEFLSNYLLEQGVEHEILNAKNHEREGQIIAQAGRPGAVTLATNMAGRGVDIKLGGNPVDKEEEKIVVEAGGLFVLGTERHESRRIDNQLRGRSARQGDPGETQFFVSTDDDLMRIFAGDRLKAVMTRLNVPEDMPIEQKMITRMLESAQAKVEGHNFDIRKHLLDYDDILNRHRTAIYKKRRSILELANQVVVNSQILDDGGPAYAPPSLNTSDGRSKATAGEGGVDEASTGEVEVRSLKEMILEMIESEIEFVVSFHTNIAHEGSEHGEQNWNIKEVYETMRTIFPFSEEEEKTLLGFSSEHQGKMEDIEAKDKIVNFLLDKAKREYEKLEAEIIKTTGDEETGKKLMHDIEKNLLLRAIDTFWVDHLVEIDHLRKSIGLQGYAQRDPLIEYKRETFHMFNQLQAGIQKEVVYAFFKVGVGLQLAPTVMANDRLTLKGATKDLSEQGEFVAKKPRAESGDKIGRNDPCYCGSGKKFKKCHGV